MGPAVRIAIDARKLHDFGIGTYIRNLLRQLARLDRETEYVLLCQERDAQACTPLGENFRAVADRSRPYSMREQISIPWSLAARARGRCSTRRITCCRRSSGAGRS